MGCTACGACCDDLGFDLEGNRADLERRLDGDRERDRVDAEFILGHWHMRPDATDRWSSTCDIYDPDTNRCGDYENRPPVCRDYPWYGRPTLDRTGQLPEQCGFRDDWQPVTLKATV